MGIEEFDLLVCGLISSDEEPISSRVDGVDDFLSSTIDFTKGIDFLIPISSCL